MASNKEDVRLGGVIIVIVVIKIINVGGGGGDMSRMMVGGLECEGRRGHDGHIVNVGGGRRFFFKSVGVSDESALCNPSVCDS